MAIYVRTKQRIHCKAETSKNILEKRILHYSFWALLPSSLTFYFDESIYAIANASSCKPDTHLDDEEEAYQNICFSCPIVYPRQSHIEAREFRILIEKADRDEASTVYSHTKHDFLISQMKLHLHDSVRIHFLRACPIVMKRWRA